MFGFSSRNSMEGKRYRAALERAAKQALEASGILLEGEALLNIKMLGIIDTGRLRGSITYATKGDRSWPEGEASITDGVSRPDDTMTLHVGTNVEYAAHNEYGTVRMPARPYLRPALKNNKRPVKQIFRDTIRKALRRGR